MTNDNTTTHTLAATLTEPVLQRLEHFAWLIDNAGDDRSVWRLMALWGWAGEMVHFQSEADRTGKPVEYYQRGRTLRVLYPKTKSGAA